MKKLEQLYRQIIMDHYKNPRNKGLKDDEDYQSDHIKNPSCGDDITIQSKVEDGVVKDIRHEGSGCSICCSSASVLSELLKGKTVEEAEHIAENYLLMLMDKEYDESIDFEDAVAYQGVKQFPARIKCATIAFKAFQNTLK
ncbi:MAG: Fe-S cluster assembly sulfur transfer protein SufU [Bacillota bacterium]